MDQATSTLPRPTEYLDAMGYLRDYFHHRKRNEQKFSFESWSKELGIKSRSHLRMILLGKKKITDGFIEAFCKSTGLNEAEQEYLFLMVQYTQSKNQTERRLYFSKMIQMIRSKTAVVEIEDHFRFLSNPLLPRAMTLLTFDDFIATSREVGFVLDIAESEADRLLTELESIGLAQREENEGLTRWKSKIRVFKVPDQFGDLALSQFHTATLQDAVLALHEPRHLRRYRSLILPLSSEELQELYSAFDEFMSSTVARFQSDQYRGRRLFQLNLNLFPVAAAASFSDSSPKELDPVLAKP